MNKTNYHFDGVRLNGVWFNNTRETNCRALITLLAVWVFFIVSVLANPTASFAGERMQPQLKVVSSGETPFFEDDLDFDRLGRSIKGSIAYYQKLSPAKRFAFGKDSFTAAHLIRSLERFQAFIEKNPSGEELSTFIQQHYRVYSHMNGGSVYRVLFTGYYEPLLHGSLTPHGEFRHPVYPRPDDLVTIDLSDFSDECTEKTVIGRNAGKAVVPYFSRRQIEEKGVSGISALPIAWVNDPVALFFLHIQGSGKIRLDDGVKINVHYHISNGHPYRSIGKYLIDTNKLSKETVSMQSIRAYLNDHPQEADAIFNYNPRYIFFETLEKGPVGCFNIELTPGRSIALDRRSAPAGVLVFVQTQKPEKDTSGRTRKWTLFSRFLLNQDTGSAITGPGRADIFWGNGPYAEFAAGYMKHPGKMFFLVLKPGI